MAERRRFTPEFKRQAVELLNAGQRPTAEIARELGIARNQLYKWQTELRARGNGTFSVRACATSADGDRPPQAGAP
jgi:transposase